MTFTEVGELLLSHQSDRANAVTHRAYERRILWGNLAGTDDQPDFGLSVVPVKVVLCCTVGFRYSQFSPQIFCRVYAVHLR